MPIFCLSTPDMLEAVFNEPAAPQTHLWVILPLKYLFGQGLEPLTYYWKSVLSFFYGTVDLAAIWSGCVVLAVNIFKMGLSQSWNLKKASTSSSFSCRNFLLGPILYITAIGLNCYIGLAPYPSSVGSVYFLPVDLQCSDIIYAKN